MKTVLNVLWLLVAGIWLALAYAFAGLLACITIVGIPFGVAAFRMTNLVLWPFGRTTVPAPNKTGASTIGNVVWFLVGGWWLTLAHVFSAAILALTIIGIPLAIVDVKLIPLSLAPFGKRIVST